MVWLWVDVGYCCICFDVQYVGCIVCDGVIFQYWDVLFGVLMLLVDLIVVFGFVFFLCMDLVVSGVCWFKEKGLCWLVQVIEMVVVVDEFLNGFGVLYGIENLVSVILLYWCKFDYMFYLYEFMGFELMDNYSKKICIWVGGDFEMLVLNCVDGFGVLDNCIYVVFFLMIVVIFVW